MSMRRFGTFDVQTGDVFIEATVKVRVQKRYTLNSEDAEDYLMDALYDGDIEIIEQTVNTFDVTDIQTETEIYEDY